MIRFYFMLVILLYIQSSSEYAVSSIASPTHLAPPYGLSGIEMVIMNIY